MAPREQVKSDIFRSKVDLSMLDWFRRRFDIPSEYILQITKDKAHESCSSGKGVVVYQDQLEAGLRFPLDPFVKLFLNAYGIAPGQLHPNSYRILTGFIELMHREGKEPSLVVLRYIYSLQKKRGELAFSLVAVPQYNIFIRLKDLPKSWRNKYFVVEHPSEFDDVRCLWSDECQKVRRVSKLPSEDLELIEKYHFMYALGSSSAVTHSRWYLSRLYPGKRYSKGEFLFVSILF